MSYIWSIIQIHLSIYISNLFFIGPARTANLNNNLRSNWYDQNFLSSVFHTKFYYSNFSCPMERKEGKRVDFFAPHARSKPLSSRQTRIVVTNRDVPPPPSRPRPRNVSLPTSTEAYVSGPRKFDCAWCAARGGVKRKSTMVKLKHGERPMFN